MKLYSLWLVLAAGTAGIAYHFISTSEVAAPAVAVPRVAADSPDRSRPDRSNEAALQRQIEDLQRRLAGIDGRLAAASSPQPAAAAVVTQPVPDVPHDPQVRLEQERGYHEYMLQVDAAFEREDRDRSWADQTAESLHSALEVGLRGGVATSIDCRSTTCRVEIVEDGSGELNKSLQMLVLQLGQALPNMAADRLKDGGGRNRTILYFSRS